jgi:hypothetical protein
MAGAADKSLTIKVSNTSVFNARVLLYIGLVFTTF